MQYNVYQSTQHDRIEKEKKKKEKIFRHVKGMISLTTRNKEKEKGYKERE